MLLEIGITPAQSFAVAPEPGLMYARWDAAPASRGMLLRASKEQMEVGECAYRDFVAALNSPEATPAPREHVAFTARSSHED